MAKIKVTIEEIEESLCDLDTEYREALAKALMELNYISDSPLRLSYGTEQQKQELKNAYEKPLKANEIKEIINFISKEMKGDFQYGSYTGIASMYLNMADRMNKNKDKER